MSVRHNEQFNGKFDYIDHHGSCKKCPKKQSKKIKPAQMMLLYSVIYKQITLFWTFWDVRRESQCKIWKTKQKNLLDTILIVSFLQTRLFTETCSRTMTIHPGIFHGRALWADSVSPRMNTIASSDLFKPIKIGENLVVNYNKWYFCQIFAVKCLWLLINRLSHVLFLATDLFSPVAPLI